MKIIINPPFLEMPPRLYVVPGRMARWRLFHFKVLMVSTGEKMNTSLSKIRGAVKSTAV